MAVRITQQLKQGQNLMMTPALQQAIKLLTLTHMEMTNVISKEMVENPLLEEQGHESVEKSHELDAREAQLERDTHESASSNLEEAPIMSNKEDDFDWNAYIDAHGSSPGAPNMATVDHSEGPNYENMVSKGQTLADHLEWQLRMEDFGPEELNFGMEIIGNINDDGYLEVLFDDLVKFSKLSSEECQSILSIVQRFDPIGCGARNLTDCLLAQAAILEERSPLLEKLIRDHLKDLEKRDFAKIAKATGVTSEQVQETALLLKQFNPRPGRLISAQDTHYVVPDIYVHEVGGEFVVAVNDEGVPRLKISRTYLKMLQQAQTGDEKTKEFVEEKLKSAKWLIKSIENRQKTIYRVAKAIVRQQQNFFKKGPKFLKPMVLKNIAEDIGVHESTVSRVTTNKYMHTPIGVFELKYFFNAGIGGTSNEVVKIKIKTLVDNENPKRPLSDEKISKVLKEDGIGVARRTVAKYREELGILSSSKRKQK